MTLNFTRAISKSTVLGSRRSSKNPQSKPANNFYEKQLYKAENNFGTCNDNVSDPNAKTLGDFQEVPSGRGSVN
jgi:hypothetical protein